MQIPDPAQSPYDPLHLSTVEAGVDPGLDDPAPFGPGGGDGSGVGPVAVYHGSNSTAHAPRRERTFTQRAGRRRVDRQRIHAVEHPWQTIIVPAGVVRASGTGQEWVTA